MQQPDTSPATTDPDDVSGNQPKDDMTPAQRLLEHCRCDCGCGETFEAPTIWES